MKKIISSFIFIIIVIMIIVGDAFAAIIPGDTNGDGTIDNKDVVVLFRFVSGNTLGAIAESCDFNEDGVTDNKDVVSLFRAVSDGAKMKETDVESEPASESESETETETENTIIILPEYWSDGSVELLSLTTPVARNEFATMRIKGKPDIEYEILVYYSSGASKAEGLESRIADSDGYVEWTWKIGGKTNPGEHTIKIKAAGEKDYVLKTSFITVEQIEDK